MGIKNYYPVNEIKFTAMTIREKMYILHHIMEELLQLLWKPMALLTGSVFLQFTGPHLFAFITPAEAKEWALLLSVAGTSLGAAAMAGYKLYAEREKMHREMEAEARKSIREEKEVIHRMRLEEEKHILEQIKGLVAIGFTHQEAVERIEKSKLI